MGCSLLDDYEVELVSEDALTAKARMFTNDHLPDFREWRPGGC